LQRGRRHPPAPRGVPGRVCGRGRREGRGGRAAVSPVGSSRWACKNDAPVRGASLAYLDARERADRALDRTSPEASGVARTGRDLVASEVDASGTRSPRRARAVTRLGTINSYGSG
jgi:hypothetical protein